MIDAIIRFSVHNRLIIILLTLGLIIGGVYNFTQLPIDAVPDITNNQVQVVTTTPALAPQEVEQLITFPVEIAMANIQGVTEIRSISRFGLSVVTIVFEDKIDTYLARQMVSEQIQIARNEIPEGYGTPELMPVTTGLGEIYQYVIEPLPGYENDYDAIEIRTVQDWIVKRRLSGIPGIVEISSFGGYLKQYEITIKPRTLVGMNLSLAEIFEALENNNQNSGGSYIEKGPNALYIRAEGMIETIEDIENISIKKLNGNPILIKDVATVRIGAPPRFGAMTKDGKGEAVGGITLMLKGANTSRVIESVKERIAEIQSSLPKGLVIKPYLDRSELISRTIKTVRNNLVEGGLIVIFVLVLLLGNLRAGIIVASVIPLSMLFAFSMMRLFGVSANLMSLGAIDFGLIVDGSVIIVEGIIHQISKYKGLGKMTQDQLNKDIQKAGSRVSKSAVFGVIIILIVYLPILVFTGIEGKMFKPMAQTVSFALLGALILSLTYVPVISSLFLSKTVKQSASFSDKIIRFFHRAHAPVLLWSLKNKIAMLSLSVLLIALSFFVFSRMGGEFIPTLEEGDLAAQMTLQPGSSLSESIKSSTKAEKVLMENFPEVKAVVSKIGTAEVPTDPMAVEDADIMIILKPKHEWTSAGTREELVEKMKEALSILPGLSFEFQQPIQLRFNELMTGVKSDVAVKIYGEDLDVLYEKAVEAASHIQRVNGAGDVKVEQVVGLPQLVIKYKRDQLARFGLSVQDINTVIKTAFAGASAGIVLEGEKRFDLVLRLCEECRNNIQALRNLRVNKAGDELILLSQVADINIQKGPMQVSRDDTRRRITIGINVRNRDIESFVKQISSELTEKVNLPPGYYFTYGGQFENLQAAKRSSSIAVPIALAVILVLLYFAFYSLKQAIMIFTAIPLAAVGGIWALYLRGMPFSISAGVGFIALFGVAVLNGIVLISYYNHLDKEGVKDILERVKQGTAQRLRPVIMTASVAALGFIPMALSTAPGAEVQRPLATVVIGGLITATILTLVVLPVIYVLFNKRGKRMKSKKQIVMLLLLLFTIPAIQAQEIKQINMEECLQLAEQRNLRLINSELEIEAENKRKSSSVHIPNPEFMYEFGQINTDKTDYYLSIMQAIDFPTKYIREKNVREGIIHLKESEYEIVKSNLFREIRKKFVSWQCHYEMAKVFTEPDSMYQLLLDGVKIKYEQGDIDYLSYLMIETKRKEHLDHIRQNDIDINILQTELMGILRMDKPIEPKEKRAVKLLIPLFNDSLQNQNPELILLENYSKLAEAELNLKRSQFLPDLRLGYFRQSLDEWDGFEGWMVGVSIPIWFWSQNAEFQSQKIQKDIADNAMTFRQELLATEMQMQLKEIEKLHERLRYFESTALHQAKKIKEFSKKGFISGDIDYLKLINGLSESLQIELEYIKTIEAYNYAVIELYHIIGSY